MTKRISLLLAIIACLQIQIAYSLESNDTNITHPVKEMIKKEWEFAEITKPKIKESNLTEEQIDIFRILNKDELKNIMSLNEQKIFLFGSLSEGQIKKLAILDINGLRKILYFNKIDIDKITQLSNNDLQSFAALNRARQKHYIQSNEISKELSLINIEKINPIEIMKTRIISQQKSNKAEERFQIANQNLNELKNNMDSEKKLFLIASSNNDDNKTLFHTKNFLNSSSEAIINHLEKIKSRIEQTQELNENHATLLTKDINNKIEELEEIQLLTDDATSITEIKKIASRLKSTWNRIRIKAEYYVFIITSSKTRALLIKSEVLEQKLEYILTDLEKKHYNVNNIEILLSQFSDQILDARLKFDSSMSNFSNARSTGIKEDIQSLLIDAKEKSEESRNSLRASQNILKEIVKQIRLLDKDIDFEIELDEVVIITDNIKNELLSIEIEGFLNQEQQSLINKLVKDVIKNQNEIKIIITAFVVDDNPEINKQVKGRLTLEQKEIIQNLEQRLEIIEGKVIISITNGEKI